MADQERSAETMIERDVRQLLERSYEGRVVHLSAHLGHGPRHAEAMTQQAGADSPQIPPAAAAAADVERAAMLIEYFSVRMQRLTEAFDMLSSENKALVDRAAQQTKAHAALESRLRAQSFRAEQAEIRARVLKRQASQLEENASDTSTGLNRLVKAVDSFLALP